MTREEQLTQFDINGTGIEGQLFGLPFTPETAQLIIVPVPWEATVSYHSGTANAPADILRASRQIDFYLRDIPNAWEMGIAMLSLPDEFLAESERIRTLVKQYHDGGGQSSAHAGVFVPKINEAGEHLNVYVKNTTQKLLDEGKMVGILGGDHSTPFGFIRSLTERHDRFGILQIDAHADLRKAYGGLTYSHGSIMYNVMKIPAVTRLVQVGVRDCCEEEIQAMKRGVGRVRTFFDDDLKAKTARGKSWNDTCAEILQVLPEKVYISFDIDGLDPKLCPHTGTPVPGGLEFYQVQMLIRAIAMSGRKIIGFDLVEVGSAVGDDWDANVGSRILWLLCNWMGVSNGVLKAEQSSEY